jgi:hypothetical protein
VNDPQLLSHVAWDPFPALFPPAYNWRMSEDRKPSAGFWFAIVLVVLAIGYPLSFGPLCWLSDREILRTESVSALYRPILAVARDGRLPGPIGWYACLGAQRDADLEIKDGQLRWKTLVFIWPTFQSGNAFFPIVEVINPPVPTPDAAAELD